MDHKTFKTDLTYACKKFAKEGKILSAWGDNLVIQDGAFVAEGDHLDALEMLTLIKGYVPTSLMTTIYHDKWVGPNDGVTYEYHTPHYTGFNLSLVDVLIEQAQIAREDLYSFLDGFDNIEPSVKSEFHTIGVYIREKFLPVGARAATLTKKDTMFMMPSLSGETVRKFYSFTVRGKPSIFECELTEVANFGAKPGEKLYQVQAPVTFKGDKWYSMFLHDTLEESKAKIEADTRNEFARLLRKKSIAYTEEDVQAKLALIQVIML